MNLSKILVLNGPSYASAVEGLGDIVYDEVKFFTNPKSFSLVLFTGGEDVTPSIYGHSSPNHMCYYNEGRDRHEANVFEVALKNKIRMIGICRGIQFLNVMAGGQMYHDVNNHSGQGHMMQTSNGKEFKVSSLHHQMIIPPIDAKVIGWSTDRMSDHYYGDNDLLVEGPEKEPEAALFPRIESAGVQYHPEFMDLDTDGYKWFHELANDLIEEKKFSDIIEKYSGETCLGNHQYTSVGL